MRTPAAMISYATFLIAMTAGAANAQTGSTDLPRVADDTPPALSSGQHPTLKALPPPSAYTQRATPLDREDPTDAQTAKSTTKPTTSQGASANGTASGQAQPAVH